MPGNPSRSCLFYGFLKVQLWSSSVLSLPAASLSCCHPAFIDFCLEMSQYVCFFCVHVALFSLHEVLEVVRFSSLSLQHLAWCPLHQEQYMFVKLAWWNHLALSCKNIDLSGNRFAPPELKLSCFNLLFKQTQPFQVNSSTKEEIKIIILLCRSNHKFHFGTCSFNILYASF